MGPVVVLLAPAAGARAGAQEAAEPPSAPPVLPPVVVTAPPPVPSSSEVFIPGKDFELLPQGRPADLLRLIPGFVISQHQGGGKAEQYLLRGFDADHGTDVALFVDGLPVNLRSHAHGQGYADLHFLIPETVKQAEVFKGPYVVEFGDFATAGAVRFETRDVVEENVVEATGGMFGTQRYLTLLSPTSDALKTLIAVEGYATDGPFDHPSTGAGIVQIDRGRILTGGDARSGSRARPLGVEVTTTAGAQFRLDRPRVILANQRDRRLLGRVQDVTIVEQSYSPFVKLEMVPLSWLRLVTGARGDVFHYDVHDNLHGAGGRLEGHALRARPSVKTSPILLPLAGTELFANFGTGV